MQLLSRSLFTIMPFTLLFAAAADTGIKGKSPHHLASISHLTQLTRLHLGGLEVSDHDIAQHIGSFSSLRDLDLWCSSISTQGKFDGVC